MLRKKELLLAKKLNLSYAKSKYFNCQIFEKYKICVKNHQCDTYKEY